MHIMVPFRCTLKHELLFCLLITIAIAAIYGQVVNHEFVSFDDPLYIDENQYVQQGLTSEGFKWAFGYQNEVETWHPLTWLLHMLNYAQFGMESGSHLLMNTFWHMLNTCLLFFLLHRMSTMFWPSAIVASLFAVHPLNVETVAWVSELKNLFSTFFWLLSMAAYFFYTRDPSFRKYMLLVVVFATGLLAKPMLVTLPFVFLLMDYWPLQRISFQSGTTGKQQSFTIWNAKHVMPCILEKIPLLCISILTWYVVSKSLHNLDNVISFSQVPLSLRVENIFVSYASYLYRSVWPIDLVFYYPFPKSLSSALVAVSVLLLGSITYVLLIPLHKKKYLTVGWLWFLGTLTPVSGLIQTGNWPAMANRYAYVPIIGLFIIYAWCIQEFNDRQKLKQSLLFLLTVLIVVTLGVLSWQQVRYWKNSESLYRHALSVSPLNYTAHNNLGRVLVDKGKVDEAMNHFHKALDIDPYNPETLNNLGATLMGLGRFDEAILNFKKALRNRSNSFEVHNNLASAYAAIGNTDDAIIHFKKAKELNNEKFPFDSFANALMEAGYTNEAIRNYKLAVKLNPNDEKTLFNLGVAHKSMGRIDEAIRSFNEALRIKPDYFEAFNNLGLLFSQLGNNDSAIVYFNKALVLVPENAEIHYNLAGSLEANGRSKDAKVHYLRALEIQPDFFNAHNNLGILLAQEGQTEKAVAHFKKALQINPKSTDSHINMGIVFYNLGNKDEALYHFQQAVKLEPENQRLKRMLHKARSM